MNCHKNCWCKTLKHKEREMLGRQEMNCVPSSMSENLSELYKRDIFTDLKCAIDYLQEFNDKLKALHPDVIYKIRSLI